MNQESLFHETLADAIGAAISQCGGFKKVAGMLWPAMKIESAYARLKACIDDSKPEKLSLDEIDAIGLMGREAGSNAVMNYLTAHWRYRTTEPITPQDDANKRLEEMLEAHRNLTKMVVKQGEHIEAVLKLRGSVTQLQNKVRRV